uniref:WS_DGAT_C domain-containing protein n=1 Tax=Mesocestoides corti TaxID=53468 RepID=A0A5K3FK43_MESCO
MYHVVFDVEGRRGQCTSVYSHMSIAHQCLEGPVTKAMTCVTSLLQDLTKTLEGSKADGLRRRQIVLPPLTTDYHVPRNRWPPPAPGSHQSRCHHHPRLSMPRNSSVARHQAIVGFCATCMVEASAC